MDEGIYIQWTVGYPADLNQEGNSFLLPLPGGSKDLAEERLSDLQKDFPHVKWFLAKREVIYGEWHSVDPSGQEESKSGSVSSGEGTSS